MIIFIRVEISFDFWFVYDLLYGNMMYNFFFFCMVAVEEIGG